MRTRRGDHQHERKEDGREDFAAILRGDKAREDQPVATQVDGHAAIQMKERILQYNKKNASDNKLGRDMPQTAATTGLLLKVAAVAVVVALFWLAMNAFSK